MYVALAYLLSLSLLFYLCVPLPPPRRALSYLLAVFVVVVFCCCSSSWPVWTVGSVR